MKRESESDNLKLKQVKQGSCLENKAAIVMIQLYLTCGEWKKMVTCLPMFLKHFVYICVRANSQTSRNRYLVGKDKRKQPFSLYQYPGEGGRQPD